jgi:hypothetical protein
VRCCEEARAWRHMRRGEEERRGAVECGLLSVRFLDFIFSFFSLSFFCVSFMHCALLCYIYTDLPHVSFLIGMLIFPSSYNFYIVSSSLISPSVLNESPVSSVHRHTYFHVLFYLYSHHIHNHSSSFCLRRLSDFLVCGYRYQLSLPQFY